MMKLRSKKFLMLRSSSNSKGSHSNEGNVGNRSFKGSSERESSGLDIKWEVRPSGMLVQKRETRHNATEESVMMIMITLRVSTISHFHQVSIQPTSTFGELKKRIWVTTGIDPKVQRLIYRGKEREDEEHLHMVGVGDKDKVLLLEDPSFKDNIKLGSLLVGSSRAFGAAPYPTLTTTTTTTLYDNQQSSIMA